MKDNNTSTGGISFLGLLTVLFIGLKLTGVIEWGWFWVLAPMLLPISFALIIVFFIIVVMWTK